MTDSNTNLRRVDETFNRMLINLHSARNKLSKAASPTQREWQAIGVPLTPARSQALTITSGAINDAKAAIDRAMGALLEALGIDRPPWCEPPRP